ncbi:hypothetical protein A3H10_05160 [Candidatus Uhrbacteria bacterium RIFCSPLOWO2_12_FULL_46_10]|uniref:Uncharacterized protein n=1 Tax=Candidatus Uhrbacteria bacterium RIFCSPLOWO2_01_FULL_47_25 TaxID=1802402 RepID=A0A1F7UT34_9BACT|nr:MAG: hypothetical protein UX68_C0016G0009 [Parcubacteria group bacterium GW2011_GWA2_46_9]OGL68305.1 MAG: hypothetical protein A3D60_05390 [Candidatus Uhrbacteria bacterium RIFCSPHIGHO2_02_FULL_47_29]OGL75217.1 MAG: hypothetical protein A3E96_03100 [Candidatus Uhrbacteria bacterium RIFCSPHIGHO2_12_FULL_46_13]OGL81460.1 MAG: hypothetical protein A2936_00050 [Candidatus Uhrbacteria bacterium RIFCSPLOWO2_01_FULL_47_25]OGL85129.1 MAG: hypothetical protein A3I37_04850 [Candidatus Uhrbacteria bact
MNQRKTIVINLTSSISLDTVAARVTSAPDEGKKHLGTFFVLLRVEEIATLVPWATTFAKFLEDTYYHSITLDPMMNIERALSITMRQGRNKLQQICREARNLNSEAIHYCFGALKNNNLFLTHSGVLQAYLLHQFRHAPNSTSRYRWLDIFQTPSPHKTSASEKTIAQTIVSGPIGDYDTFILCAPSITDLISLERLEKIIGVSLEGVETTLAQYFRTGGGRWAFGAIILRPDEPEALKVGTTPQARTTLADKRSDATVFPVTPNKWPIKRLWQSIANLPSHFSASKKYQVSYTNLKSKPNMAWRLGRLVRQLGSFLILVALLVILAPIRLMATILVKEKRQQMQIVYKMQYDILVSRIVKYLKSLPRSAQRLLVISLLFAFLFVQSLVFLAARREREAEIVDRKNRMAKIQEQLDEAESNIIFHNTKMAVALIQGAEELINNLPQKTHEQQQAIILLKQSLEETRNHLERTIVINTSTMVGEASSIGFTDPDGLLLMDDQILLYRGENNSFAQMSIKTGATKTSQITSANIGRLKNGIKDEEGRLVFMQNGRGLAVLNLISNTLSPEIVENARLTAPAFSIYNKRLYLLDPIGRQIWRYQKTASGYGRVAPWLKGNTDAIAEGNGLIVDGSVYILFKNGIVKKYDSGNETAWGAQTLLKPPALAERLQAPIGSKSLYALDRASRRVFVWDRIDGHLVTQYSLPNMQNLKDFAVDEKNNLIYILNGSEVLKISLTLTNN